MNKEFTRELFISATYQTLWGLYPVNQYRRHTASDWDDYTSTQMGESWQKFKFRAINPKHTICYNMKLGNGKSEYVIDRSFHLNDTDGNCLLIAGVAKSVPEEALTDEKQMLISDEIDLLCVKLYQLLTLPNPIAHQRSLVLDDQLTDRQQAVFRYLLMGLTAKEIAHKMDVSFRTVESHTDAIKKTFNVQTKSELITLAIEENWITLHI